MISGINQFRGEASWSANSILKLPKLTGWYAGKEVCIGLIPTYSVFFEEKAFFAEKAFDRYGNTRHSCGLIDFHSNTALTCRLSDVEPEEDAEGV